MEIVTIGVVDSCDRVNTDCESMQFNGNFPRTIYDEYYGTYEFVVHWNAYVTFEIDRVILLRCEIDR